MGSAAVPVLGVPHVFLLPALLCALCGIAFVGIERAAHRMVHTTRPEPNAVVVP